MQAVEIALGCEAIGACTVLSLEGREAMSALSSWEVRVHTEGEVDLEALIGAPATIALVDPAEGTARAVALIVTDAACEAQRGRDRVYALQLSDPAALLELRAGYRVFLEKTTEQIVAEVLRDAGIPGDALVPRLAGAYPARSQCVQYGETEWAFVERLLADEGISCWFETTIAGKPRIFLGDEAGSHDGIEGNTALVFAGEGGTGGTGARALHALAWEEQVVPERVMVRDFDVRQPDVYIEGEAGEGDLEVFEYPANVPTSDAARQRAQRRLEQLQRERVTVSATTDCIRVQPGRVLSIAGAGAELFEQRMLVAEVRHSYAQPLRDGGKGAPYRAQVTLRPTKGSDGAELPAHRPRVAPAPRVEHLESAVTTGPGGEEIHVDDLGRVKLRFLWDRSGIRDDRSSDWARALQYPLGASMFLPRVGWEVAIGYLDGLPERPFVLGRLYNATAVPPYALPGAGATTSFQSQSSPRSGMTQEIRMGDGAGKEEFFVHASKDLSVKVGGSQTTEVGSDEEHLVLLSLTKSVTGDWNVTIGAQQNVAVGKELVVVADGSNTEMVAAVEMINVTGNRAVVADGSYAELIGGSYGIQCNQSNANTSGVFTRAVGGSKGLTCGLGAAEAVAGARTYVCRGSRVITCSGNYGEGIYGGKRSSVGAVNEKAGGNLGVQATVGRLSASGATTLRAGSKFSISAPSVTIDVSGSLLAETLEIGGGALKTKGGTTEIDGDTTRVRGGEVGG